MWRNHDVYVDLLEWLLGPRYITYDVRIWQVIALEVNALSSRDTHIEKTKERKALSVHHKNTKTKSTPLFFLLLVSFLSLSKYKR